ncbi:MAG: site-specific integrase [Clostridiales bacterium]|nr:site-specific integrase [Clostridiales bacterium]
MANNKSTAFFEAGSWYHRVRLLQDDGSTKYSKKGGFQTAAEAERSYREYDDAYKKACRAYHASASSTLELADYLIYWNDEIYSARAENTSRMLASYVLYDLIFPNMNQGIKLRYVNAEYLDALLASAAKACESAGNKCRELLNIALKDAVAQGYLSRNPVPDTKPYKRRKPKIRVLNQEKMRFFLEKASESKWYLEILLGLFMGLRKGEISGLKFSDFDMEKKTVRIERQITANPIVPKGQSKISEYQVIEKDPKTPNSCRTLRVPDAILDELNKRKVLTDMWKEMSGEAYIDRDYVSCAKNGLPHATSSFNTALTKLCKRNGLPHLTVHSLRHMYATILTEQGVPLVKVSALLGHSSIHTTFEYYCEVMDENERIINFMNDSFVAKGDNESV